MYLVVLLTVLAVVAADDIFPTEYDNINIDGLLQNQRILSSFYNCVMDRGICSQHGLTLKKYLPEAIKTNCEKCSTKQKEITRKILKYLLANKREWYDEFNAKYDPEGKYRETFRQLAED